MAVTQVMVPNAQTKSHISTVAQTNESRIPSEMTVSGQSRANLHKLSGTEDVLMTPHQMLLLFVAASSRRFNLKAVTCVTVDAPKL